MATKKKAAKKKAVPKSWKKATVKKKAPLKKKGARRLSLTSDNNSMIISVEFRLGGGKITATLFRNTVQVDEQTNRNGGTMTFTDARSGDELSINGACSGNASLTTNLATTPASDASSPRKYKQGDIFDSLGIN